ncbi:MAG: hypothetical protein B0A82_05765 [Alkalinema sp. CACIAM 70d]|nr:MAG: hypothetical protein B0A82_05765 [Alkalinema sp. CACIAM 70d]
MSTLKEHPIWHNVTETLEQIDPDQIANEHLQACHDAIQGYWDEDDQFYKTIRFTQRPTPKLMSRSIGLTSQEAGNVNWLQLKYSLTIPLAADGSSRHPSSGKTIGELSLILNDKLDVIDENWLIDINSPYVLAIR